MTKQPDIKTTRCHYFQHIILPTPSLHEYIIRNTKTNDALGAYEHHRKGHPATDVFVF